MNPTATPFETIAPHHCLQHCAFTLAFTGEGAAAMVVTGGWPAMLQRYRSEVFGVGVNEHNLNAEEWQGMLENLADLEEYWVKDEDGQPYYFHQEIGEISRVTIYRLSSDLQPVTGVTHHALAELVALKQLRDSLPRDDDLDDAIVAKQWREYRQRKEFAWQYARAILAAETRTPTEKAIAPWSTAQTICDVSEVDQAIRAFIEDPHNDSATFMVRAVLDAFGAHYTATAAQLRPDLRQSTIDVVAERTRQIVTLGRDAKHDDETSNAGDLASAAAAYALNAACHLNPHMQAPLVVNGDIPDMWPAGWNGADWKPRGPRRDLVRAGALVLAEIDRIDRSGATTAAALAPTVDAAANKCYSVNGQDFDFTSLAEVLEHLSYRDGSLKVGQTYHVGDSNKMAPSFYFDIDSLVQNMLDCASDHCGEHADDFLSELSKAPMATSNSPTFGQSNSPMAGRSDYDESPVMAIRAAASLSR